MALTQNPSRDNWPLLVESLPIVEGALRSKCSVRWHKLTRHRIRRKPTGK